MTSPANNARSCPECGANLFDSSPQAPCPACLMQLGMEAWAASGGNTAATMNATMAASGDHQSFYMDASVANDPAIDELSRQFPQLEILHMVGQGGMGAVYCARQKSLNRLVALKVIKPDAKERENFADRFVREARALAQLNHPNIITVHDFGENDGIYYFIMEYVDGINLRQMLHGQRLTPRQALEIVPAVCDALQYAHDKGIVHRDIKPENILIDTEGHVRIADFGLAKLLDKESVGPMLTQAHDVMGTMHYMAPEQIEKPLTVDHRADIYSLGVVIYELLTGELPLGRFAPPSQKVQVDIRLDEIVLQTLEKEPSLRYQKVSDVKTDMQTVAAHARHAAAPMAQPAPQASYQPVQQAAYQPAAPVKSFVNAPAPPFKHKTQTRPGPIPRNGFWGVLTAGQTYKNLLYMLLSFPLGVFYFVLIITGLSSGIGTVIVWIGLFILLGTFLAVRGLTAMERGIAINVLNVTIPPHPPVYDNQQLTVMSRATNLFTNSRTWLGIVYLLIKFPLSLISFVFVVTLTSLPLACIATLFVYDYPWADVDVFFLKIDTLPKAAVFAAIGLLLAVPFLHVLNGFAWLHAQWARVCLSGRRS